MTNWTKHTGTGKPPEMADAQIVEFRMPWTDAVITDRADSMPYWGWIGEYRPALTEDGRPYVSADGLEEDTEYVCVDEETGDILQCTYKPRWEGEGECAGWSGGFTVGAPETHRIPGDPENSLARVWR